MPDNLKNYIYEELKVSSSDIKKTIKLFSAYLNEFDSNFKYNYKFLVSHVEDFEISNSVHIIFKNLCSNVINVFLKDKSISNMFSKIISSSDFMSCSINFNNALQYRVIANEKGRDPWLINGTLPRWSWSKIKANKHVNLNISIDFICQDFHFSKRFFDINPENNEILLSFRNFFNDSYHSLVIENIGKLNYKKLKALKISLFDNYNIRVVIDDSQSLIISNKIEDDFIADNLIILENNTSINNGTIFIKTDKKEYKYSKSNLKDIESIKNDLINKKSSHKE